MPAELQSTNATVNTYNLLFTNSELVSVNSLPMKSPSKINLGSNESTCTTNIANSLAENRAVEEIIQAKENLSYLFNFQPRLETYLYSNKTIEEKKAKLKLVTELLIDNDFNKLPYKTNPLISKNLQDNLLNIILSSDNLPAIKEKLKHLFPAYYDNTAKININSNPIKLTTDIKATSTFNQKSDFLEIFQSHQFFYNLNETILKPLKVDDPALFNTVKREINNILNNDKTEANPRDVDAHLSRVNTKVQTKVKELLQPDVHNQPKPSFFNRIREVLSQIPIIGRFFKTTRTILIEKIDELKPQESTTDYIINAIEREKQKLKDNRFLKPSTFKKAALTKLEEEIKSTNSSKIDVIIAKWESASDPIDTSKGSQIKGPTHAKLIQTPRSLLFFNNPSKTHSAQFVDQLKHSNLVIRQPRIK